MESQTIDPPATAEAAAENAAAPAALATGAVAGALPGRKRRGRWAAVATFSPVVTATVALAVHRGVHNWQNAEPTGVYARFLVGVMIAYALLGATQRLWQRTRSTWRNFAWAAVSNLLHWFVSSAP